MNDKSYLRKVKRPVPPSSAEDDVTIIPALDFITLGSAARERRLLRREAVTRTAANAKTSKSLLTRFEAGDCDGISYKSMYKVFREMSLVLYVDGLSQSDPSHLDISEFIKYCRSKSGKTLRALSELSGIPSSTIFGIENCDVYADFNYSHAINILEALGHSACIIHVDDFPSNADDVQTYNFRCQSGHAMYKSPYTCAEIHGMR